MLVRDAAMHTYWRQSQLVAKAERSSLRAAEVEKREEWLCIADFTGCYTYCDLHWQLFREVNT